MPSRKVTYKTKAQQVEQYLRESIRTGAWVAGQRLPAETELMSSLKVSRSTLREALNLLYKDELITRTQGQGTFVSNDIKAGTILMIVKSTQISGTMGYWTRSLAEAAKRLIEGAGYRFLLLVAQGDTDEERTASINVFHGRTAGDIVGALITTGPDSIVQTLYRMGIPFVSLCDPPVQEFSPYHVFLNYEELVETSVELLRKHGHNDFAVMITHPTVPLTNCSVSESYDIQIYHTIINALMRVCDFSLDRLVLAPNTRNYYYAYDAFMEWWSRPNRPKAMFFTDDALFDVSSSAIRGLGIDVPGDLAVITQANIGRQFQFPVEITKVGWDAAEVISAGWNMLQSIRKGVTIDTTIVGVSPAVIEDSSLSRTCVDEIEVCLT